ncbi:hypothetical protein MDOR_30820 [Mycolicibacterium doricum]|uniref:DUF1365 domain-containing protein n=1 Tax=Mycolicibacterium doricum TaxID=126673 RepID=A0A1X1TJA5_9MYCO|nr:DUF1365 family protein [Mycolicibacterium doricum]MCV7267016.1 DUF1365 family protein [Mycolicibacterium doricum]ORV44657.1 hypothetical protein AWC01_02775 [Mycolicibacterium doricum]BBZ08913.1 hypothetical protein MDOR_30820 [Mycolicibacterium doricum]
MTSVEPKTTPALYRTRVTHLRRAPVHHYFELNSYSWYVDLDELPRLPVGLRSFARFDVRDHFDSVPGDTLRARIDTFLRARGIDLGGGRVTALLQPRVLGFAFTPLSLFWCHDSHGVVRHVIAEVRNTHGEWYAYVMPPDGPNPAMVRKRFYASPFNGVDGYYLVRAPRPDGDLDLTISLHRENQPAIVSTLRGSHRPATVAQVLRLQMTKPMAPQMIALSLRVQGLILRARRVPVTRQAAVEVPPIRTTHVAHSGAKA